MVNGIDFFVRLGVRDVVGLLVGLEGIRGGREVGGGREKGLLAGWWLLSVVGTGIQFWFGVNDVDSVRPLSSLPLPLLLSFLLSSLSLSLSPTGKSRSLSMPLEKADDFSNERNGTPTSAP